MSVENNAECRQESNRAGVRAGDGKGQPEANSEPSKAALSAWFQNLTTQLPELSAFGSAMAAESVSGDASFRAYYRVRHAADSLILMDSVADKASVSPFLSVAEALRQSGVSVPRILAADTEQGFICMEDFGDALLLRQLKEAAAKQDYEQAQTLYHRVFEELLLIQSIDASTLPRYDEALLQREMALFRDWLCEGWLALSLTTEEHELLTACFGELVEAVLSQPQGFVHRDFHSRNLMCRPGLTPGVIDFQDAVFGPLSYDLVSLLKDCYIVWPPQWVQHWAMQYLHLAQGQGLFKGISPERFWQDFELMGVQRHLKAAGIFARLFLRDGKAGYLKDVPRTLGYIDALETHYEQVPSLQPLQRWMRQRVLPALAKRLEQGEPQK